MESSISVEETNKIRISLGLKPVTEDGAPTESAEQQAEANYARQREQQAKTRDQKIIADRIAKVRNRRELNATLKGATLGDADGDDDTLKWVKQSKKRAKQLAKKRLEDMASMDNMFQEEYTERDLEGLKVNHDFEDLDEGDARILILKDSEILNNEEDELQNVEMAEEEKRKKVQDSKTKLKGYSGYDDDEFVEGAFGTKRSVLAKYDEDIDGPSQSGFRLGGGDSSSTQKPNKIRSKKQAQTPSNKTLLSIDYTKNVESSDYIQEGDIGFKKPKTKKKRSSKRAVAAVELAEPDEMEVDEKPLAPYQEYETNLVDDDELQASLARVRRAKLKKSKKVTEEDITQQILQQRLEAEAEAEAVDNMEDSPEGNEDEGLTFDDTTEFVRTIGYESIPEKIKVEPKEQPVSDVRVNQSPSRDVSMAPADEAIDEMEVSEVRVKDEDDDDDEGDLAMLDALEIAMKEEEAAREQNNPVGTAGEQTFKSGMASTLNILRQQGLLAAPTADQTDRERVQLQRDLWLADHRRQMTERELERMQSRGGNKDQATREYENRLREQQEARANLESFKNYKPDVNIVYYDEFGRSLTPKEAWKALSHKFHGKGSGKAKTEKRLKKIAEEQKKAAMASGDTPLSMNKAFQERQEKTGQAHFVLSVGNRGAVPQMAEYFDAQPLSKGKTEKARKKKAGKGSDPKDNGFMTVPAPSQSTVVASGSTTGSPAPSAFKAGFSRISSAVDTPSPSGTPVPGERSKVAFGFGTKRKADDDATGTPPPKRR